MIDHNRSAELREAIELMYFAYRAFTGGPDQILAERGLGRVHHRILYFVGRNPQVSVSALLDILRVSKQALNLPLRQLIELDLVHVEIPEHDRRRRQLSLSRSGRELEQQLTLTQLELLQRAFSEAPPAAEDSWRALMRGIMKYEAPGAAESAGSAGS